MTENMVFITDEELNFTSMDPAGQRAFGYSKEDINKINLCKMIYEDDRSKIVNCLKILFLVRGEYIDGLEFRTKAMNGSIKQIVLNVKARYGENDNLIQIEGVIREITDMKKLEQKRPQNGRLNSPELQASMVAHELNNILGTILGYLDILKFRLEGKGIQALNCSSRKQLWPMSNESLIPDTIGVIEMAARDGAAIVGKLQQFTRTKAEYKGVIPVNIIDVVNDAIKFTIPRRKEKALARRISYEIINNFQPHSALYIKGKPTELREVFVNIIHNSIDAMPNGGKIEISANADAENVVLSTSDNGMGIKKEMRNKIFNPFFTTKGVNGSGLGMSVMRDIVKSHGGEISIDSYYGKGTTVHVKIPKCSTVMVKCHEKVTL